ncbi:MAG TPA: hypothetical protein PKC25_17150 [Candidatus Rifleibacterium sp.]|nr:hypothetical protein [Candidatus Rifleibacterium sp.]
MSKNLEKMTLEVLTALVLKARKGDVQAIRAFFELREKIMARNTSLPVLEIVEVPFDKDVAELADQ